MTITAASARLLVIGALVAVAGPVLGAPAPALGHNYLVSSTPQADSTLTELPDQFSVTTNEPLLVLGEGSGGFALQVQDEAGAWFGDGCVEVDGSTVSAAAQLGAPGEYTLAWQVVSADGHTVSDQFSFTWAPAEAVAQVTGAPTAPVCGTDAAQSERAEAPTADTSPATPTGATTSDSDPSAGLWIVGGAIGVILAVGATILALRRRKG